MAMTGHKSVSSLAVYQKVAESEKIEMGSSLGRYVVDSNQNQCVKVVNNTDDNIDNAFEDLKLDDWNINVDYFPSTKSPLPAGFFNNCNINNLHVHITK